MSKRARSGRGPRIVVHGGKRNVDKQIIGVSQTVSAASNSNTLLWLATTQLTIVGVRWNFAMNNTAAASNPFTWMIVHVREGNTANNISTSNTNTMYAPEQDVIAWGVAMPVETSIETDIMISGSTKTMRKLQAGDQLRWIAKAAVDTIFVQGGVQFFTKI